MERRTLISTKLTDYIYAALRAAHYEILEDGMFYGEIPACPGVLATGITLEACRTKLQEVLEDWIVFGLRMGHEISDVDGHSIAPAQSAA